jgi:hypothetical protein
LFVSSKVTFWVSNGPVETRDHTFARIADEQYGARRFLLGRACAVGQFGLEFVHELPRGAPAASGVPAVP